MGAAAAAGLGLSALGLGMSQDQNRKANNLQKEGTQLQRDQAVRAQEIYSMLLGTIQDAEAAGAFNPASQIAQLDKDRALFQGTDQANLAGSLRTSGYRPGDSEIGNRSDAIALKYQAERDRQAADLRSKLPLMRIQAYSGLNAPQTAQIGQSMVGLGAASMSDPSNLIASAMSLFGNKSPKTVPTSAPMASFGTGNKTKLNVDYGGRNYFRDRRYTG